MPRRARLDAPDTLHHVIVRGIEKNNIVSDDRDRQDFVNRLGTIALETATPIYAWALMPNHAHILLRSGPAGLSHFMRRLLSGYAISYNLRHKRHGHLFQNRYKSIICEEEPYYLELVRYIHLNPLRAKLVEDFSKLDRYRYCGHAVLMGKVRHDWQNRDYTLRRFGLKEGEAKRAYRHFVKKGVDQGRREDLIGGGLIRSQGGWSAVKAMRRLGIREKSDERILGSGEFVRKLVEQSDRTRKEQFSAFERSKRANSLIEYACQKNDVSDDALKSGSRRQQVVLVRTQLAKKLVKELGLTLAETGRHLGVSASAIGKILYRSNSCKSN